MRLVDRRAECGKLDGLVEAVCAGQSRALVLSGEAGVGKSALLQYLFGRPHSAEWYRPRAWSRRWSWRSPPCISYAHRC